MQSHPAPTIAMNLCEFCHGIMSSEDLDNPDAHYVEVSSWVTGPKLHSPVLRKRTGLKAHTDCIKRILDGEAADQEPLPGLED